jgi:hypothetical protein
MPIEIKELHVKIQVNDDKAAVERKPSDKKEDLLESVVDEVFTIINNEKER